MSQEFVGDVTIRSTQPSTTVGNAIAFGPIGTPSTTFAGPATIRLAGNGSEMMLGRDVSSGATARIHLDGQTGDFAFRDERNRAVLRFDATFALLEVGGLGNEGDIRVRNDQDEVTIHLDGRSGDIRLFGADCAEEFAVEPGEPAEPGSVMRIGGSGRLEASRDPYDSRVVGVVSGAGGLHPGIILGRTSDRSRVPIALAGRVVCRVDASGGAINPGDLLTTSGLQGRAMRVSDRARAVGAILGKALAGLSSGTGSIPVLVGLQ